MKEKEIRNWLGIYFLIVSAMLAVYILLCKESPFLPISKDDAIDAFEIIIPVLIGQLTIIFKWYSKETNDSSEKVINIPSWVVKGPPIIVSVVLIISIVAMIIGNSGEGKSWAPNGDTFQTVVTFCVSFLNASTIFIVMRFFKLD